MKATMMKSAHALMLAGLLAAVPAWAAQGSDPLQASAGRMTGVIGSAFAGPPPNVAPPAPAGVSPRADAQAQFARTARELAMIFPADKRHLMEQGYNESMQVYQQIESKMGWPRNDVSGAIAAFIVGNYIMLTGEEISDEQFAAVANQLRRASADLARQDPTLLRSMYEQCAMVGTFMFAAHKSLQKQPQPMQHKHLRDAARENLRLALGTDPERLQMGLGGFGLR